MYNVDLRVPGRLEIAVTTAVRAAMRGTFDEFRETPLQALASQLKFGDTELAPFYDVLLSRPDLDLTKPGLGGRSTLEDGRLLGELRPDLLRRLEEYAARPKD